MQNFKRQLLPVTTFARIDIKRLFRDKVAIFFVFVFPLIFLIIFGAIFGKDRTVNFRIAVLSESQSRTVPRFTKC